MKTVLSICTVLAIALCFTLGLQHLAFASARHDVTALAIVAPAPAIATIGIGSPVDWPWDTIAIVVMAVLGALVSLLRVLAPLTKTKADDQALTWLEKIVEVLAKILVPGKYRLASLGGGKGETADNVKFPPTGRA